MVGRWLVLQEVSGHHRGEHACNQQGRKDRKRGCPAELFEELARDSAHEGSRQKYRNQGEGGCDNGQANFIGCIDGRLDWAFPHA